jgi:DNA-binding transcriptional LysR family regulator
MTLNQLRIVVAIADAGYNITHAATLVHATQPGLSKQLKQLEDYLGHTLFVRQGKSIKGLTPAGERILVHARNAVTEARQIRTIAANLKRAPGGSLRIATVHTQARYVLPPVIGEIRKRWPDLSIDLSPGEQDEALARLKQGEVDVAVISTSGSVPQAVLAVPAYHWHRVAVVPRAHPLAQLRRPLEFADLAAYPLISYRSSRLPESSLHQAFADHDLAPDIVFTARDADVIKAHVRAGLGVGLIAAVAVEAKDHADLAVLDISKLFARCTTWIALRRGDVIPHYVRDFVSLYAPQVPTTLLDNLNASQDKLLLLDAPVWPTTKLAQAA